MALWWLLRAAVARVGLVGEQERAQCRQRAGCNAGTLTARGLGGSCREVAAAARDVQAKGRLQPWNSKGCRPEGVVAAASNALTREGYVRGKVPHLRWSQAPPRLGEGRVSADSIQCSVLYKNKWCCIYCITACFIQFILYHVILYYIMSRHAKSHTLVNYILY